MTRTVRIYHSKTLYRKISQIRDKKGALIMAENMQGLKRTQPLRRNRPECLGQELVLMGWCHKQRDLGGLVFITLRDRSGEIQLLIDDTCPADVREKAARVRSEYVIAARGMLQRRASANPNMTTGEVELLVQELRILSASRRPRRFISRRSVNANEIAAPEIPLSRPAPPGHAAQADAAPPDRQDRPRLLRPRPVSWRSRRRC